MLPSAFGGAGRGRELGGRPARELANAGGRLRARARAGERGGQLAGGGGGRQRHKVAHRVKKKEEPCRSARALVTARAPGRAASRRGYR